MDPLPTSGVVGTSSMMDTTPVLKKAKAESRTLYIAWDIEKLGDRLTDPLIGIGFCWGYNEAEWFTRRFVFPWDRTRESAWNPSTWEWWQRPEQVPVFNALVADAEKNPSTWMDVSKFVDELYRKAELDGDSVVLHSDNPCYDGGHTDFCLWRYADRRPMRFNSWDPNSYRSISDPTEQIRYLDSEKKLLAKQWVEDRMQLVRENGNGLTSAHLPDYDACKIFHQAIALIKFGAP